MGGPVCTMKYICIFYSKMKEKSNNWDSKWEQSDDTE